MDVICDGWWDEVGWGRQPMRELRLRFDAQTITGSGHDIVGLFTFSGTIDDQGRVIMIKRYLGQHTVEYLGTYDGEGLMWGKWHIGPFHDKWTIRLKRASTRGTKEAAIEEFV